MLSTCPNRTIVSGSRKVSGRDRRRRLSTGRLARRCPVQVAKAAIFERVERYGSLQVVGEQSSGGASWELASPRVTDRFYEFLAPSPLVAPEELAAVADQLREGCPAPEDAAQAALEWPRRARVRAGGNPCAHVGGRGVEGRERRVPGLCSSEPRRPASHGYTRSLRVGLFHPKAVASVGAKVLGESHAWVEVWTGDWRGYDPTNVLPVENATSSWRAGATTRTSLLCVASTAAPRRPPPRSRWNSPARTPRRALNGGLRAHQGLHLGARPAGVHVAPSGSVVPSGRNESPLHNSPL